MKLVFCVKELLRGDLVLAVLRSGKWPIVYYFCTEFVGWKSIMEVLKLTGNKANIDYCDFCATEDKVACSKCVIANYFPFQLDYNITKPRRFNLDSGKLRIQPSHNTWYTRASETITVLSRILMLPRKSEMVQIKVKDQTFSLYFIENRTCRTRSNEAGKKSALFPHKKKLAMATAISGLASLKAGIYQHTH